MSRIEKINKPTFQWVKGQRNWADTFQTMKGTRSAYSFLFCWGDKGIVTKAAYKGNYYLGVRFHVSVHGGRAKAWWQGQLRACGIAGIFQSPQQQGFNSPRKAASHQYTTGDHVIKHMSPVGGGASHSNHQCQSTENSQWLYLLGKCKQILHSDDSAMSWSANQFCSGEEAAVDDTIVFLVKSSARSAL